MQLPASATKANEVSQTPGDTEREVSTSVAARELGRSTEYVRQAVHRGLLEGRVEQLRGDRSRIWVKVGSLAELRARHKRQSDQESGLSSADLEIELLRTENRELREAASQAVLMFEIQRLRTENARLKTTVTHLVDQYVVGDFDVASDGR
jgi:hypothetical protein